LFGEGSLVFWCVLARCVDFFNVILDLCFSTRTGVLLVFFPAFTAWFVYGGDFVGVIHNLYVS